LGRPIGPAHASTSEQTELLPNSAWSISSPRDSLSQSDKIQKKGLRFLLAMAIRYKRAGARHPHATFAVSAEKYILLYATISSPRVESMKLKSYLSRSNRRCVLLAAFLGIACLSSPSTTVFGQLSITSDTTQNGGVLQVPNAPNTLNIGHASNPLLTLTNGANGNQVQRIFVGNQAGHSGSLLLEQNSVMELTGLNVTGVHIGNVFGSNGLVRVRTNALLSDELGMLVGVGGFGTLIVEDGGQVRSRAMVVAMVENSQGSVLVTGNNSRIDIGFPNEAPRDIFVGSSGTIGTMIVSDGGAVTATGDAVIGFRNQGQLSLFDQGSSVTLGGEFWVGAGQNGQGTATVAGGATLTSHGSRIGAVASNDGPGTSGSVTLTGANSLWTNHGELRIGTANDIGGNPPFPSSGSLTVTNNASLVNSDLLTVGHRSSGTLVISGGGTVSATATNANFPVGVDMGHRNDASATATVTGANSTLNANGHIRVGVQGNASLTISNGGVVNNVDAMISFSQETQSSQSSVTVTGQGSQWNSSGNVYVGGNFSHQNTTNFGGVATLTVRDGGLVLSQGNTGVTIFQQSILTGGGGTIIGNTIENRGIISPGDSIGEMTLGGNFLQAEMGTLNLELGGLIQGLEYDHLIVTNQAFLGGTLEVSMFGDFQLGYNQVFDVLTSGGPMSGQFLGLDDNSLVGTFNGVDLFIRYAQIEGPAGNSGVVRLYSAVPEPSGLTLVGGIGLLAVLRRHRRQMDLQISSHQL